MTSVSLKAQIATHRNNVLHVPQTVNIYSGNLVCFHLKERERERERERENDIS